ncbi:AIR synthase-related protein, partial [Shewanella sp. 0m-11]
VVQDVRNTVTPELRTDKGETDLLLLDLGLGQNRLGGSCLAQVYSELGDIAPDLDNSATLKGFFETIQPMIADKSIIAYHDRSDGGLYTTLVEMAFAGHTGLNVDLSALTGTDVERLFNEELGAVIQVRRQDAAIITEKFAAAGVPCHKVAELNDSDSIAIFDGMREVLTETRTSLRTIWAETTYRMQALRDNPECAKEEFELKQDASDLGLTVDLSFDPSEDVAAPFILKGAA